MMRFDIKLKSSDVNLIKTVAAFLSHKSTE